MDYLTAFYYFVLVFARQIVGEMEMYKDDDLCLFYVNSGTALTGNFSTRYTKSIDVNLSMSCLLMTRNVHKNLEKFCEFLTKVKVIALVSSPNFDKRIEFTIAGKHLAIPVLSLPRSSEDIQLQKYLRINLYPRLTDSLPKIIEISQTLASVAAVICNVDTYDEIEHFNKYSTGNNIKLFQISSSFSSKERIQKVADMLAKIRILKITILVVYVVEVDLNVVLTLSKMMQMTGEEYRWFLPWGNISNQIHLPSNAVTLLPKNSNGFQNIFLDAVDLVKQGLRRYTKKNRKDSVPFVNCFNTVSPSFGGEFYKHIVEQSFDGKTGYFAFDKQGNRVHTEYEVVNLNKNQIVNVNTTTPPFRSQSHKPKKIRVVTALSVPFVYLNKIIKNHPSCGTGLICHVHSTEDNHTKQFCCEGYIIEMLHLLQTDIALDIDLRISKDGKYGTLNETTKQWDGMIGELIRNEADIAIADLTITNDRARVVDFTHPFMEIGLGVLVRVDRKGVTKGIWAYLQPVAAELWIATFIAISFMGILFWAMERIGSLILDKFAPNKDDQKHEKRRKTVKQFSFAASLHYSWSTVVRTRDKVTRPSSTSAKIGAISLATCFLVFITTYTAQLAAFLVAELKVTPITGGISDSKLQNPSEDLRIATITGSSIETFFRTSRDPNYVNIWKHMVGNNVPNSEIGAERLRKNQIDVFINDYNTVVYIAAQDPDCSLCVIGEPFFKSGYGLALQKNSNWTSIFTQKLLQYEKSDIFLELAHRWMKISCEGTEESVNFNTFHRMSWYDVTGMFVVLAVGVLISWLLLAAEFYYKNRQHRNEPKNR